MGREARTSTDGRPQYEQRLRQHVFPRRLGIVAEDLPHDGPQIAVHPLHLAVPLGVVPGGVGDLDAKGLPQVQKELAGELGPAIGLDGLGVSVAGEDFPLQRSGYFQGSGSRQRDGLHPLGEGFADGEDVGDPGSSSFVEGPH